jgi:hypothetical protein
MVHEALMVQTKLLFQHLPRRREENHINVDQNNRSQDWDSNSEPLEYQSDHSMLRQNINRLTLSETTEKLARRANTQNKESEPINYRNKETRQCIFDEANSRSSNHETSRIQGCLKGHYNVQCSIFWASWMHSTPSCPISLGSNLIRIILPALPTSFKWTLSFG